MKKAFLTIILTSVLIQPASAYPVDAQSPSHYKQQHCLYEKVVTIVTCFTNKFDGIPITTQQVVCIGRQESGLRPRAENGPYKGVFQLSWFKKAWNEAKAWAKPFGQQVSAFSRRLNPLVAIWRMSQWSRDTIRGQWSTADNCGV